MEVILSPSGLLKTITPEWWQGVVRGDAPGLPRMTMYWIYDLPNWQLAALIVVVLVGLALAGLFATRPVLRRVLNGSSGHNDIVSYFFAGVGVFYGLALGLIAVATWQNFIDIDGQVSKEAAAIAGLYRDLDGYPGPFRAKLERKLRDYTRFIVEKDWPAHRRGESLEEGTLLLDDFENEVMGFEPTKEREKIAHAEVLRSLDVVVEQRRLRLQSVGTGLPAALWAVVLIGAGLNIVITYLFWVENVRLHTILVVLFATFLALLVFLTAAMDNPFLGEFSVSPDVFQAVLDNVMRAKSGG
jgi:hypothetical protein